jgi:phospholipase C
MCDLLQSSNITWKFYDGKPNPHLHSLWNPLPGFQQFQADPRLMAHLTGTVEFYTDLSRGTLPAVSWIVPNGAESEHPPASVPNGLWYVTVLINAVMQSPCWDDCAIISSGMITAVSMTTLLRLRQIVTGLVRVFRL